MIFFKNLNSATRQLELLYSIVETHDLLPVHVASIKLGSHYLILGNLGVTKLIYIILINGEFFFIRCF